MKNSSYYKPNYKQGHLVFIKKDEKSNLWKIKCDCGNIVFKSATVIKHFNQQTCSHSCPYIHDITGQVFYNWTVVSPKKFDTPPRTRWLCKCKCGNISYVDYHSLTKGLSKSCGCLGVINKKKFKYPTNKTLTAIKSRCYNKNNKRYTRYGERGIFVCDEWNCGSLGFKNFYKWSLSNGWKEGLTIERIDINKGYSPENCKWITLAEQALNTSRNHFITYKGETLTISQWAKKLNIKEKTLSGRFCNGWSIEKAIETPVKKRNKKSP